MRVIHNRKDWIDIMKGIGILCVVAGHIIGGLTTKVVYIFHMPLFFFIGGYLFRERKNQKEYFIDKFIHLIIPYFAFLFLIYIPVQLCAIAQSHFNTSIILKSFFYILAGGRALSGYVTVFWFATCFFLVQQVFNFIVTKYNPRATLIIVLIMLLLSYINSIFIPQFWLPWNANVVLAALPIFYIGFVYKKYNFKENRIFILSVSVLAIASTLYTGKICYNMKIAEYGIPIITLLCSTCLILSIKNISSEVARFPKVSKVFIELGRASMIIMYLHQPIQLIITYNISSNEFLRFILSTFISYIIYLFILRFSPLRALLLGSKDDFKELLHFKIQS